MNIYIYICKIRCFYMAKETNNSMNRQPNNRMEENTCKLLLLQRITI